MNTITHLIDALLKKDKLDACLDVLDCCPDAHLIMVSRMSVKTWGWGHSSDPDKEYRIPEEFDFETDAWRTLWEELPSEINDRIVEFFEEQGCNADN